MTIFTEVFLRRETYPNEHRTPLTPKDVRILVNSGLKVYVQSSDNRVYSDKEYEKAGAIATDSGWHLPYFRRGKALIIGIKELENLEFLDHNTHAYFSHSFKNQKDSKKILDTFLFSKSDLYDFEYFLDNQERRKISFGFYAGQVGAILGLLHKTDTLPLRLTPWNSFNEMLTSVPLTSVPLNSVPLNSVPLNSVPLNSVLPILQKISIGILGVEGRCGKGVQSILNELNIPFTPLSKDSDPESFKNFDIFYNCIILDESYNKVWFDTSTNFTKPLTIVDISCDSSKPNNPIKIYTKSTVWDSPVYKYNDLVSVIAIDNMPSLLPRESSDYFSGILTELILEKDMKIWEKALSIFFQKAVGIY